MRLVLVLTLETNEECLPKFVQTHDASSSIKTANAIFVTAEIAEIIKDFGQA